MELLYFRFGDSLLPSSIHKNVLVKEIPGFKSELANLESKRNELNFPEELADPVSILIEWCYAGKLAPPTAKTSVEDCTQRIKLYCLAARYDQVDLTNTTMDYIMTYMKKGLPRWDV